MDEPMAGLDYGAQIRLMLLLQGLKRKGVGVLLCTHHTEHVFLGFGSHRAAGTRLRHR